MPTSHFCRSGGRWICTSIDKAEILNMRHRLVLFIALLIAGVLAAPGIASAEDNVLTLIPCSTPYFSGCYDGGSGVGLLTLRSGSIRVDEDGEVWVVLKDLSGNTAVENGPPYSLQLYFFEIEVVNQAPDPILPIGDPFTVRRVKRHKATVITKADGHFHGNIGQISGPMIGFFTINSAGTDTTDPFGNYAAGAREQFITGIR